MENRAVEVIKETCAIEDIIGQYTRLTGSKPQLKGMCPLHKDNKPSFYVNTAKGVFFCHGCHKGGDVISFVQQIEKITFPEAISFLAEKYGLDIEGAPKEFFEIKNSLNMLQKHIEQSSEMDFPEIYLHERGVDVEEFIAHGCGYLPDNQKTQDLLRCKHLRKLGIHRMVGRIMFPFYANTGTPIGYGARTIEDETPKYINSANANGFNKSECLFGLARSKKQDKNDFVVIVEGYLDVLAVNETGVRTCVATCGTALTDKHAKKLSNIWRSAILCMDADPAGRDAVKRAIPILYKHGMTVFVAELEEGEDPHSYSRKHLALAIQEARPGYDVLLDDLPSNPFEAASQLRPILMNIPVECKYVIFDKIGAKLGLPRSLFDTPSTGMPPSLDILVVASNPNMDYLLMFLIHSHEDSDAICFLSPSDIKDPWYKWAYTELFDGKPVAELITLAKDNPSFAANLAKLANTQPPADFANIAVQAACLVAADSIGKQIYEAIHQEPADFNLIKQLQKRRLSLIKSVNVF